jgi:hypothetical protein
MPAKGGITVFLGTKRNAAHARNSVRQDWCARLPEEKDRVFNSIVRDWEDAYAVFSVPLDDAVALRSQGQLVRALQCVEIAASVVTDLTAPLAASCRTIEKWGRQLAVPPAVSALNPSFYRSEAARQNAQWNQLTHRILFGSRSRFLHKLHSLEISIRDLGNQFHREAEELCGGIHIHPESSWPRLDDLQYDVNTCLRETVVVLKSFVLALPPKNLAFFREELNAASFSARETSQQTVSALTR